VEETLTSLWSRACDGQEQWGTREGKKHNPQVNKIRERTKARAKTKDGKNSRRKKEVGIDEEVARPMSRKCQHA